MRSFHPGHDTLRALVPNTEVYRSVFYSLYGYSAYGRPLQGDITEATLASYGIRATNVQVREITEFVNAV